MSDILQEILQSLPFLISRNFETWVANDTESNVLNRIFANKGIVEQGWGHLFITSSNSHFFNKTDLEQYRCKVTSS